MDYYSKNISFLEKSAPVLYNMITSESDKYDHYLTAKKDDNFQINYNNKKCWVNSKYSFDDEFADTFVNADYNTEVLILVGIGNGAVLKYIKENFKNIKVLFIIEPFLSVFKNYVTKYDFKEVFSELGEISFIVNQNETDAGNLLVKILADSTYTQIEIISLASYNAIINSYISVFKERVLRGFRSKVVQLVTLDRTKYKWLDNTILNFRNSFNLQQNLSPCLKGKPGVIIGAGPSLNQHLHLLEALKEKAIMIGASSAIRILNTHGIQPHFKMVIDAYPDKSIYDDDFYDVKNANPLLYASQSFTEVVECYKGPKFFMLLPTDVFGTYILNKAKSELRYVSSGASVVQSAFSFLAESGCNPIILLGQDMCFYENKLYAEGIDSMDQSSFDASGYIKMNDIYGNEVYTVRNYLQIKYDYETLISRYPNVKVINATEGGLGIDNAENRTLNDVMENELIDNIEEELQDFIEQTTTENDSDKLDIIEAFKIAKIEAEEILSVNGKRIEYLKKFEKKKDSKKYNQRLMDFEYIDKALIGQLDHNELYTSVVRNNIAIQTIALKQFYDVKSKDMSLRIDNGLKYYYGLFSEIEVFSQVCLDWIEEYLEFMENGKVIQEKEEVPNLE